MRCAHYGAQEHKIFSPNPYAQLVFSMTCFRRPSYGLYFGLASYDAIYLVGGYHYFGGTCCLHLHVPKIIYNFTTMKASG